MYLLTDLFLFSFEDYVQLKCIEWEAVQDYMSRNDPTALGILIQGDDQHTPDFKRFIADLVTGKKKRPIKKTSTSNRDYGIYQEIEEGKEGGQTATAIKKVIGGRVNLSPDAIQKAYDRGKKIEEEYRQFQQEEDEAEYREAQEEYWQAIDEARNAEFLK